MSNQIIPVARSEHITLSTNNDPAASGMIIPGKSEYSLLALSRTGSHISYDKQQNAPLASSDVTVHSENAQEMGEDSRYYPSAMSTLSDISKGEQLIDLMEVIYAVPLWAVHL